MAKVLGPRIDDELLELVRRLVVAQDPPSSPEVADVADWFIRRGYADVLPPWAGNQY